MLRVFKVVITYPSHLSVSPYVTELLIRRRKHNRDFKLWSILSGVSPVAPRSPESGVRKQLSSKLNSPGCTLERSLLNDCIIYLHKINKVKWRELCVVVLYFI